MLLAAVLAAIGSACAHLPSDGAELQPGVEPPKKSRVSLRLSSGVLPQGGVGLLWIDSELASTSGKAKPLVSWEDRMLPVFALPAGSSRPGADFFALLPVPHDALPGIADVRVTSGEGGSAEAASISFRIEERVTEAERVRVKRRHAQVRGRARRTAVVAPPVRGALTRLYDAISEERLWSESWRLPAPGEITGVFGAKRVYNSRVQGYHLGLDIRARTGDPVAAPAGGRVVLAARLFLTGNTVIIDHGLGVYTNYAHLSRLKVRRGQLVRVGELVGLAGNTGRSSGPHLHWGAVVHGIKVDPLALTQLWRDFPLETPG